MSVNVDIADLPPYTYYSDERTRQLEELIRKDLILAECRVKRRRTARNQDLDPFIVLDSRDNELVNLDQCEIDVLEDTQLLSYIKTRKEIEQVEGSDDLIIIIPVLFASLFVTQLIVTALIPTLRANLVFICLLALFPVLGILSGYLVYGRVKTSSYFNRELLAAIIKENPTFLDSLRLLANQVTVTGWKKQGYRREIQYYEEMIAKLDS